MHKDNEVMIRRCYRCEESVLCNLNIVYTASNSTITLWNKYQIYVYEDLEFNFASKVIVPEFQVRNLITANNYLVCLDYTGNIHTTSLKFKISATQKRFKGSFQPRERGVTACILFSEDVTICLKYESNEYLLCIHKINAEYQLQKSVKIKSNELLPSQSDHKYILKCHPVHETQIAILKAIFNKNNLHIRDNYSLILISFDRLTVYSCLFSTKMIEEEVTLVKLYTCPSEISDIEASDAVAIIISLKSGTIISLNLKEDSPKIIHLNTAIHKFIAFEDKILYTNGLSMWVAENILSDEVVHNQLFVKNVYDFIKFGDHIICTTYNNLLYTFSLDDEKSFIEAQPTNEYCPAEKVFEASYYLENILTQVRDIDELLKRQKQERDYIMVLSLSNRQDIMDEVIKQKVIVYENYKDAITENTDAVLTNKISEYLEMDSFYFLIKIITIREHKVTELLSNSIGDLRVHITLISGNKILKTNTIKIKDFINNITLLLPLKIKFIDTSDMRVDIQIVTNIPGAYDDKQRIWAVLYRKSVMLNSEHFIKFNFGNQGAICLKEPCMSFEEQIMETAMHQYGSIIKLSNVKHRNETKMWQMYVRLPSEYQIVLSNGETKKKFTSKKVNYFLQLFTSENFLKSKSSIYLTICKEKVKIETDNDGFSTPSLKISGHNIKIVLDIRNFLSNLIYCVFADFGPGKEFVSHSFYITVENLQKALKEYQNGSSKENILDLITQFERKVIGALPI